MDPPINPKMATKANGIKYHLGKSVVKAPIGSAPMASFKDLLLAARSEP